MSKIEFKISSEVRIKMEKALKKYGDFEIGGILIGRKIEESSFEIIDISISDEDRKFFFSSFFRGIKKSEKLLRYHFKRKSGYYIGEWHSHPKFSLSPSYQDINTMIGILNDKNYGVSFTILLITKINCNLLEYKGYFFHKELEKIVELKEVSEQKPSSQQ